MEFEKRWHIIDELGKGGQGKVYRVIDASKFNINKILPQIVTSIRAVNSAAPPEKIKDAMKTFRKALVDIVQAEDSINHGALKVLHEPEDARDSERAETRIRNEIAAMSKFHHPNILKILDYDPDGKWFVSEFHPKGTLFANKNRFTGDFVAALKAFRPLVEGVSELHGKNIVHRDIKPQNVFIDLDGNLVLGDFGLVFFTDASRTRISGTMENVGSHAWMPPWATEMRIEDINPMFDVYSLGKLLWAMVSETGILRLWYFDRDEFNLEYMFPEAHFIEFANQLFRKCIVEEEKDCIGDASALLQEVDKTLSIIDRNADLISQNVERHCKVCGIGSYELIADKGMDFNELTDTRNFGLNPMGTKSFKIFTCNHCGNVQLFAFDGEKGPRAWL